MWRPIVLKGCQPSSKTRVDSIESGTSVALDKEVLEAFRKVKDLASRIHIVNYIKAIAQTELIGTPTRNRAGRSLGDA
jgi:hypothetical protein